MRLILLLAAAATAFAQADTNTITITASRNITVPADQVVYSVTLQTDASVSLSDVVGRLAGTGITASDLSYVNSSGTSLAWTFQLVRPFSKMQETTSALARLTQEPGGLNMSVAFSVTGQQVSEEARTQACQLAALVSDARREADRIASAAGVHVGAIVGLSEGRNEVAFPVAASRLGTFATIVQYRNIVPVSIFDPIGAIYSPDPATAPACSLVVQFRLLP